MCGAGRAGPRYAGLMRGGPKRGGPARIATPSYKSKFINICEKKRFFFFVNGVINIVENLKYIQYEYFFQYIFYIQNKKWRKIENKIKNYTN